MYFTQIEGKDLEENLEYFNVLDVRTKEEFDNGHIKNAIHIPYDEVIKRKDEIPLDKPLVIHCSCLLYTSDAADDLTTV